MDTIESTTLEPVHDSADAPEQAAAPGKHPDDVKAKTPMEHWLRRQLPGHSLRGILEALKRLDSGVPVPYLAFYCLDETEGLKSDDLYRLIDLKTEWEEIARKQAHLLQEIQAQGKLTDDLKQQIDRSSDLDRLEDLYVPFKLKRQTLGVQAREAGLAPLADYLWAVGHGETPAELPGATLEEKALPFAKPDTKYADAAGVLKGVQDILVERIAEAFELRSLVRSTVLRRSKIRAAKGPKAKPNSKYSKFFEYQEPIGSLKKGSSAHRYLAMRRGWMEDELVLSFDRPDEGVLLEKFEEFACPAKESLGREVLVQAARLALKGNVYTVMENEAHRHMKEEAERHVIQTLAENLRKKLLRPGMGRKAVMGIDPGSGNHPCSLALIDADGKLIVNLNFKIEEAATTLQAEFLASLENLKIEAIAVAHGPRSKEVREAFKKILETAGRPLPIVSVHEHTSSVYCSSPAAKEEFPALDVNTRRAVFVARYLQDPLSVILRLDPKFLSLGEFQHEVNQADLRRALQRAIEASVNFAGIDPNYAPAHVLAKVSGVSTENAKAMIQFRETSGKFKNREGLKASPGLASHFEHCAGFLHVKESAERLDTTFVHPKHYEAVKAFASQQGASDAASLTPEQAAAAETNEALVAQVGKTNAKHYAYELAHVGEDPRGSFSIFEYQAELKSFADLKKDQAYPGVVTNVTSFGAFVDIGIEQDGLVHISELTDALAKNPFDALFPGDPVTVYVAGVNEEKKQISLTMRQGGGAGARGAGGRGRPRGERGAAGGGQRRERRPRQPRGDQPQVAAGAEGAPPAEGGAPREGRRDFRGGPRGPREGGGGRRDFRGPREGGPEGRGPRGPGAPGEGPAGPREGGRPREDRAPRKPKKPMRDTKTGAIVKMDENEKAARGGPKMPSKAKPMAFNPFANLGDLLKNKQEKS
ncbi:MAG: S1 RNA-binding domain-containing protein [Bdellovibrionota bacterium]